MTDRNTDDRRKVCLHAHAEMNGRIKEGQARSALDAALGERAQESGSSLVEAIRKRVESLGGFDLELPEREPICTRPGLLHHGTAEETSIECRQKAQAIHPVQQRSLARVAEVFREFPEDFMAAGRDFHEQKPRDRGTF